MLFHTMILDSTIILIRMVKTYESFSLKHPLKTAGFHLGSLKTVFILFKNDGNLTKEQIMLQHEVHLFGQLLTGLLMPLLTPSLMGIM